MTEVLHAILAYGFEKLNLHRITADVFEGNPASERVLVKCGMKKEGTLRGRYFKNDRYIDSVCYAMVKE